MNNTQLLSGVILRTILFFLFTSLLPANAQAYLEKDLKQLIQTGSCLSCDLSYANIQSVFLNKQGPIKLNIQGSNLKGAMLRGLKIHDSNFKNTIFASADLRFVELKGADFTGADLKKIDLRSARLSEVNLQETRLIHAIIDGIHLNQVDFSNAVWINGLRCLENSVDFCKIYEPIDVQKFESEKRCKGCIFPGLEFQKKDLSNATIANSYFLCGSFKDSNLSKSTFKNSTLNIVDFRGANLEEIILDQTSLDDAIWSNGLRCLTGSKDRCVFFNENDLKRLQKSKSCINCKLSTLDLSAMDLQNRELNSVNLRYTDLKGTNLSHAILTNADFRNADLNGTDLTFSNLTYADFRGANLEKTLLSDANLNQAIWTDGAVCQNGSKGKCLRCGVIMEFLSRLGLINLKCQFKGERYSESEKKKIDYCNKYFRKKP